jgi:multidrug transporter EmrE-like cation transporter
MKGPQNAKFAVFFHRLIGGNERRHMGFPIFLVVLCVIGAGLGQVLLKIGVGQLPPVGGFSDFVRVGTFVKMLTNPYILAAFVSYFFMVIFWLGALSRLNVSFLFPFSSLAYLVTAFAAMLLLKEHINAAHWFGLGLIISGCLLVALSKT